MSELLWSNGQFCKGVFIWIFWAPNSLEKIFSGDFFKFTSCTQLNFTFFISLIYTFRNLIIVLEKNLKNSYQNQSIFSSLIPYQLTYGRKFKSSGKYIHFFNFCEIRSNVHSFRTFSQSDLYQKSNFNKIMAKSNERRTIFQKKFLIIQCFITP